MDQQNPNNNVCIYDFAITFDGQLKRPHVTSTTAEKSSHPTSEVLHSHNASAVYLTLVHQVNPVDPTNPKGDSRNQHKGEHRPLSLRVAA